jgi:hypothetical protein
VDADPDTLVTARYVTIDDALQHAPELRPWRPVVGIAPRLTDAELLTLAVMQALLGDVSEARWLRYARTHLHGLVPYLPGPSGSNQRLRAAFPLLSYFVRALASDTDLRSDTVWVADATPIECGRSRDTARRSALAGWAGYGSCRSHTRYLLGLRLHLAAERGRCTGRPWSWGWEQVGQGGLPYPPAGGRDVVAVVDALDRSSLRVLANP